MAPPLSRMIHLCAGERGQRAQRRTSPAPVLASPHVLELLKALFHHLQRVLVFLFIVRLNFG